ncbi:hypothetical protein [Streptomyces zhihengii]
MLPRSKRIVTLAVVAGLFSSLLGLRLFGNMLDFSDEDDRALLSQEQRTLVQQIEQLRSDDGMFTSAMGSAGRPGLYESAYGLTALQAATGRRTQVDLRKAVVREAFSVEMRREPLTSLSWLSRVESVTGRTLHDKADISALLSYLQPEGYFGDPGLPRDDISSHLTETASALGALKAFGAQLPKDGRTAVRRWMEAADGSAPARPVQLFHLMQIASAVGLPTPSDTGDRARTWWRTAGAVMPSPGGEEDVIEAAHYVLLADRLHLDIRKQGATLRAILDPGRTAPDDPQVAAMIAQAWRVLDGPVAELESIAERIRSRQLPSGLVSSVRHRSGSLTSTYEVVQLRLVAGLPRQDDPLRRALSAQRSTVLTEFDPLLRGAWLVLMDESGGDVAPADRERIVSEVQAATPRHVSPQNVDVWNRHTEMLLGWGQPVPEVRVSPWRPNSPALRYAQALLINGLDRAAQLHRLKDRPRPADLLAGAEERLVAGTVREAAESMEAASALGWTPSSGDAERISALLERRRDCPGASAFYRDSAKDSECGVPGTRAAYRVRALLEAAAPAIRTR